MSRVISVNEDLVNSIAAVPEDYRHLVFVIYSPLDSVTALEWLESSVGKLGWIGC